MINGGGFMGRESMVNHVQSRVGGLDQQQGEAVTHAVFYHLWRRLPFHERQRMLGYLSQDVADLLAGPKNPHEPPMTEDQWEREGSIERDTYNEFCGEVRRETGLKGDGQDETAIEAVFEALKAELPEDEVRRIKEMLPQGLNQLWYTA
jgi:uncharacterized protein (DUF2267 family)